MHKNDCKIALHVLLFDVDYFIDHYMSNCSPFFDKIYAAYSIKPWSYNKTEILNSTSLDAIRAKWGHKLTIIEGFWATEEEQRNACIDQALRDGYDYLAIQDDDEFYLESDYQALLDSISANKDYDQYKTRWNTFWKRTDYVLARGNNPAADSVTFALNIGKGVRFVDKRASNAKTTLQTNFICYHMSYVRSDSYIFRKINTWGHSTEFNRDKWFQDKWLAWYPEKHNLHPVEPAMWTKAIPFRGSLPKALEGMPHPENTIHTPSNIERAKDQFVRFNEYLQRTLARLCRSIKKRLHR